MNTGSHMFDSNASGLLTWAGNVYIYSSTTAYTLTLGGTGNITISGNVTGALATATHVYDLEGNLSACLPDSIGCVTLQGLL